MTFLKKKIRNKDFVQSQNKEKKIDLSDFEVLYCYDNLSNPQTKNSGYAIAWYMLIH